MAVGVPVVPVLLLLLPYLLRSLLLLLLLLVSFGRCSACYTTPYNVYVLRFDVVTLVDYLLIYLERIALCCDMVSIWSHFAVLMAALWDSRLETLLPRWL